MIWRFPKSWGYPQSSSVSMGFSMINHLFWGTPMYGSPLYGSGDPFRGKTSSSHCKDQGILGSTVKFSASVQWQEWYPIRLFSRFHFLTFSNYHHFQKSIYDIAWHNPKSLPVITGEYLEDHPTNRRWFMNLLNGSPHGVAHDIYKQQNLQLSCLAIINRLYIYIYICST